MAKPTLTASDVVEALRLLHPDPEWAFLAELRVGTGYDAGGGREFVPGQGLQKAPSTDQRLDAWAINCWPSKEHLCVAYEVKVSRADFLLELKQPRKREMGLRLSHQFYFAAPKGLIKKSELPPECGLVEVDDGARVKIQAPVRQMEMPSVNFLATIARRGGRAVMTQAEATRLKSESQAAAMLAENARGSLWRLEGDDLETRRLIRTLLQATGWIYEEGRGLFRPGESSSLGLDEQRALRKELERLGIAFPQPLAEQLAFPQPYLVDAAYRKQLREGHSFEEVFVAARERAYRHDLSDPAALAATLVRDMLLWGSRLCKKEVEWSAALLADELLRVNGYRLGRAQSVVSAFNTLLDALEDQGRGLFRSELLPEDVAHAFRQATVPSSGDKPLEQRAPALRKDLLEWRTARTAAAKTKL